MLKLCSVLNASAVAHFAHDTMANPKSRTASDLRTVRDLLNQARRNDILPGTASAFRLAALALGAELLSDTLSPLTDRQWGAMATLLELVPSDESLVAVRQEAS